MDIFVIVFILAGLGSVVVSFALEGGHLIALFEPTALLTIIGGTIGAIGLSFPMEELKRLPKIMGVMFKYKPVEYSKVVIQLHSLAVEARKEGLLCLEKYASDESDSVQEGIIKKGLSLIVDGVGTGDIRKSLENDIDHISERHESGIAIFEAMGGYLPTMGIIGTVLGLVHVLGNLEDSATLGPKIAIAFIATLYGIGFANILALPMAGRLKAINEKEYVKNQMIVEGLVSLQEGKNPNLMVEDMCSFLDFKEREKALRALGEGEKSGGM